MPAAIAYAIDRLAAAPSVEPAPRFWAAQQWALSAALIRRHPGLALIETAAGPDASPALTVLRDGHRLVTTHPDGRVDLPRAGVTGFDGGLAFERDDPLEVVRLIESRCRLPAPSGTPAATVRSLAYRVAAALVQSTVNAQHRVAVCGAVTAIGGETVQRDGLRRFGAAAVARAGASRPGDPFGRPLYRFWLVRRDDRVVAALDTEGHAYLGDRESAMPAVYAGNGRSVTGVLAACFPGVAE